MIFLPILFCLALPSYFLEFKRREMGVPLVLEGNLRELGTPSGCF
jgi:hypothetical protein